MKLHLGCGKRDFGEDWIHIDGGYFPHLHSHDIVNLPFEDNTVDLIYCCHAIGYFNKVEIHDVFNGWRNKLKQGGILRIAIPDFEVMAKLYTEGKYPLQNFLGPIFGEWEMAGKTIYHKTAYDFKTLKSVLEKTGFINVHKYDRWKTEHANFDDHSAAYLPHKDFTKGTCISLNVECNK